MSEPSNADAHCPHCGAQEPDWNGAHTDPPVSEWQPIETAPRDGTRILAYWPWNRVMDVTWFEDGDWQEGEEVSVGPPAHWMPLPEPQK